MRPNIALIVLPLLRCSGDATSRRNRRAGWRRGSGVAALPAAIAMRR